MRVGRAGVMSVTRKRQKARREETELIVSAARMNMVKRAEREEMERNKSQSDQKSIVDNNDDDA